LPDKPDHSTPNRPEGPNHATQRTTTPRLTKANPTLIQRRLSRLTGSDLAEHRLTKPNLTGLMARTMPNRNRPNRTRPCPTEANQARDDNSEPGQANPYPTLHHLSALERT